MGRLFLVHRQITDRANFKAKIVGGRSRVPLSLALKAGARGVTLEKISKILHCCRRVLAHFEI